jgi:hypothetical protein
VVTAFVIESYKFLQPGPNDAVVGLLFQIANSLNNTSSFPPSVDPASITTPFSPTPSSIRLNVFFFLSLILSLTTVLIGTISLQWLREHQSYPNLSPKEKAAIFHMRSEALEAWHVPIIFTALPLLLQAALVLFLAGLIDFSLPLGAKLIISVSVVVGLTLLFLGATTVLPAFQGLFFCLRRSYKQVPTPCPFKSPQSHALRILSRIFVGVLFRVLPIFRVPVYTQEKINGSIIYSHNNLSLQPHAFFPFVYTIWLQKTWLTFDREWLLLRDACHQSIFRDNPNRDLLKNQHIRYRLIFPLSDITQFIIEAAMGTSTSRYMEELFPAAVQCFQEISASIWTNNQIEPEEKHHYDHYFEQLHHFEQLYGKPSISRFLFYNGSHEIQENKILTWTTILQTLNQDQMFYFLDLIFKTHSSPQISQYQLELWSHIISEIQALLLLFSGSSSGSSSQLSTLTLLDDATFHSIYYGHPSGMHFYWRSIKNLHMLTTKWYRESKICSWSGYT